MLNGTRIVRTSYTRHCKSGNYEYFRDRQILQFTCDQCGIDYEKPRNGKDTGRDRLMHFCPECFDITKSTYLAKKRSTRKNGSLGESRPRGKTKYMEVWVGKDSWHHKTRRNNGWIRQHIFVMQEELGYVIPVGYVVHHIDGDKRNNNKENLVLLSIQEHNNAHAKSELLIFELVKKNIVVFNRITKLYEFL